MWFVIHITSLFTFFCSASTTQNTSFANGSTLTGLQDISRIRLSNHSSWEGAGFVEVFIHDQWRRVCDYPQWNFHEAEVVCRQLGYPGAEASTCCGHYFGKSTATPLMVYLRVACTGNESSLFHCSHVVNDGASCCGCGGVGVVCRLNRSNVRLVGSPVEHAGFVQIRHYGRWGSLCDPSWGPVQGHVVCRELGYQRALSTTIGGIFDRQPGHIWVHDAKCNGDEASIFSCDLKYVCNIAEVKGCDHIHDGGVICESQLPGLNETAAVRLRGSNLTHMGEVEIHQHGVWRSVCSIAWHKHDADVVCRQLGFPEAVVELAHGQFGSRRGPMWLTSVSCQGNETSLDRCESAGWELETVCGKRYGAGVICKTDNVTGDGDVRLIGIHELNSGRVEVKLGGVWGTVSQVDWDIRDGHVVCRQLGYHQAIRVYRSEREYMLHLAGFADLNVWLSNLHCSGNESKLLDCPRELNYYPTWSDYQAGVECTNDTNHMSEMEVRLSGMDTPNTGYVNISINGTWGAIWTVMASNGSVEVICRQLGQGVPVYNGILKGNCTPITGNFWVIDLDCHGFEDSIDQCPFTVHGKIEMKSSAMCLSCKPTVTNMTVKHEPIETSTTAPCSTSPTKKSSIAVKHVPIEMSTTAPSSTSPTKKSSIAVKHVPIETSTTAPSSTSPTKKSSIAVKHVPIETSTIAPSSTSPTKKCPSVWCQNGGSCMRMGTTRKCHCLGTFAGRYCEVDIGPDTVSIILKMTLDQWNSIAFRRILAEVLTSHCRLQERNVKSKCEKSFLSFQSDDVIILQGYPQELLGVDLLFVRLAIVNNESVIPRETLRQLLVNVAPEIIQRLGHGVAYIDREEAPSGQISSAPPEVAGCESDEPRSVTSHKVALIALGIVLGVVSLAAIIMFIFYCRQTKWKKLSLQPDETDTGENVLLVPL